VRRQTGSVPSNHPFVLTTDSHGRRLLTTVDGAAAAAGLSAGISLADARTLVPDVIVQPDDPAKTATLLARLADWCGRYTPWTSVDGEDGIWLDTAGCAHLFGGEATLLKDLLTRLSHLGFSAQAALASTPGAAWALARFADEAVIVEEDETRRRIASLPVAGLRLTPEVASSLSRLGLRRIGDLYLLPRAPFAARFGEETARRLDQVLGRVSEPISPRRHVAPFRSRLAFAEPIGHTDDIVRGLDRLLEDLCDQLSRATRGGRRLELTLFRIDGSVQEVAVGTARATCAAPHLAHLFQERLTMLDPGFGVETMILSAPSTENLEAYQTTLKGEAGDADESMGALLDRLGNRLGFGRLHSLQPAESHLPECAQRLMPVSLGRERPSPRPSPVSGGGGKNASLACLREREGSCAERPIRLLRDPERMTPMTQEEKDGAPPSVFRWRWQLYQLRRIEGPERIAPEWWRQDQDWAGGTRDYWRIEDAEGRRLWLYREGGGVEESRWFVHGLLA
jgi:protein ImuB